VSDTTPTPKPAPKPARKTAAKTTAKTTPAKLAPAATEPTVRPGYVVFYDVHAHGAGTVRHVGIVVGVKGGRARVKDLGPADAAADFPVADVSLSA